VAPLQEEIRINPGFASAYFFLGDVRYRQGNDEDAERQFAKAVELDPNFGDAVLGLGKIYVKRKRLAEAVPLLRRATELMPDRVEPYSWLGRTLVQLGKPEEGRKALDEVERLNAAQHNHLPSILRPSAAVHSERPQ
jgi:cytochrome c-type biogenesis protein CcmH/NrfG